MRNRSLLLLLIMFLPSMLWASNVEINAKKNAELNYKAYCWQCHGMTGDGNGINVRDMSVQPRDHTSSKAMGGRTEDDLFKVIKEGGLAIEKSVLMPPWKGTLSDNEIRDLAKYLIELCQCR